MVRPDWTTRDVVLIYISSVIIGSQDDVIAAGNLFHWLHTL